MKKIAYYTLYMFGAVLLGVSTFSCTENLTEITEAAYDRCFSPTDLDIKVRSQVNALVTWTAVSNAESYVLELYKGDSVENGVYVTEAETTDVTYTFSELDSDTDYTVRVKAVSSTIADSKWVEESCTTGTENIFNAIDSSTLQAYGVTLTWTAGADVTSIVITRDDDTSDVVTVTLTDSQIAAGEAVITGLSTAEASYTAVLYRDATKRGTTTFTTAVDLGGATAVYADATEQEISAAFADLTAGGTICFLPSDNGTDDVVGDPSSPIEITLTVPCSIKGLASKPVTVGLNFKISTETAGNLVISDLNFSGSGVSFLEIDQMAAGSDVTISGCTISSYSSMLSEANATETAMGTLTIDDCVITGLTGRCIDYQKKLINFKTLDFINNTVYNTCSGSDLIRFDYTSGRVDAIYNVKNNTLYDVNASSKGIIYIRSNANGNKDFTCNLTKNIFAFSSVATDVFFSEDSKTDNIVYSGNYYYNATSLQSAYSSSVQVYDSNGTTLTSDPFEDAANGDFTIKTSFESLIDAGAGDPEWLPSL